MDCTYFDYLNAVVPFLKNAAFGTGKDSKNKNRRQIVKQKHKRDRKNPGHVPNRTMLVPSDTEGLVIRTPEGEVVPATKEALVPYLEQNGKVNVGTFSRVSLNEDAANRKRQLFLPPASAGYSQEAAQSKADARLNAADRIGDARAKKVEKQWKKIDERRVSQGKPAQSTLTGREKMHHGNIVNPSTGKTGLRQPSPGYKAKHPGAGLPGTEVGFPRNERYGLNGNGGGRRLGGRLASIAPWLFGTVAAGTAGAVGVDQYGKSIERKAQLRAQEVEDMWKRYNASRAAAPGGESAPASDEGGFSWKTPAIVGGSILGIGLAADQIRRAINRRRAAEEEEARKAKRRTLAAAAR